MTLFDPGSHGPYEIDCECGERHIIDPAAAKQVLAGRRFVCVHCERKYRTEMVGTFSMDGHGSAGAMCLQCCVHQLYNMIEFEVTIHEAGS